MADSFGRGTYRRFPHAEDDWRHALRYRTTTLPVQRTPAPVTDLERLFRRLVDNLIAIDPARLHRPVEIAEVVDSVVPYRTNRRALGLSSSEDYDMLLLRLVAGEGGFVRTEPPESQAAFVEQIRSPNPDLRILTHMSGVSLVLETEQLAYALGPDPDTAFAPPEPEPDREPPMRVPPAEPAPVPLDSLRWTRATIEPVPTAEDDEAGPADPAEGGAARPARCAFCGGTLPQGRSVKFCPHCGENQSATRCPECQSELELGWQFCVNCGHAVSEA